jgi:beta-galactosidase
LITIVAVTAAASVQLAINGVPVGAREAVPRLGHVSWAGVAFVPGNYTLTAYDAAGDSVAIFVSATPGAPARINLSLDWPGGGPGGALIADARDVAFVRATVVDADGVTVPWANNELNFSVSGAGELLGLCNGDNADHLPKQGATVRPAYAGLARAVVRGGAAATGQPLLLNVSANGLEGAQLSIDVVDPA